MKTLRFPLLLAALALSLGAQSQFNPGYQWTLLDANLMDDIIGEASGETAFNHIIEMGGYNRNRTTDEYKTFWEAEYVLSKLKEYGLADAKIERFPNDRPVWDGISGELWEISPGKKKLADYDDLRAMLASGSVNTDVEAELIWVNEGRSSDFEGLDVSGKIVVTSGSPGGVHNIAVEKGALGVVSFNNPRPLVDPLQIPWSGIYGRRGGNEPSKTTFGFLLPPREGHLLRDRLIRGEKIRVHAKVESQTVDYDLQVPTCVIPGTDENAEEVIFSAHLFEGYTKQGANDNISGSAAILEVARMLKTMIDGGRLPQPKRSIRFIWVPEFSGTIPWVQEHKDLMEKTLCNINLDMVGLWLSKSQSFFNLERTTYANPHYVNDVLENYFRYVGETNRVSLVLSGRGGYINRIVAPSGSDEPFYYAIEHHYGASDHEVFNDWGVGVPGVMLITWPDDYYHTSEDRPDKCDPTQLKRCCVISAASAYTIAMATEKEARQISNEVFSNGSRRIGQQAARAFDQLGSSSPENLSDEYKLTRSYIEGCVLNEMATLETIKELAPKDANLVAYIDAKKVLIKGIAAQQLAGIDQLMESLASEFGVEKSSSKLTKLEKQASTIYPKETAVVKEKGYGQYRTSLGELSRDESTKFMRGIANTSELQRLCTGQYSALDMKKILDSQFSRASDLEAVIEYLEYLKKSALVTF
jgi:aminopeptidase YwaD